MYRSNYFISQVLGMKIPSVPKEARRSNTSENSHRIKKLKNLSNVMKLDHPWGWGQL